jgi:DNA-binding transcriptional MerR regulator
VPKSPDAFRTISEVAIELDVPQHVLRFWETKFTHIKPLKRAGGRRYYRPADIELIRGIQTLLYSEGYTIKGVQRILKDQGVRYVLLSGQASPAPKDAVQDRPIDLEAGIDDLPVSRGAAGTVSVPQPSKEAGADDQEQARPTASQTPPGLNPAQRETLTVTLKRLIALKARIAEFRVHQSDDEEMPLLAKMRHPT